MRFSTLSVLVITLCAAGCGNSVARESSEGLSTSSAALTQVSSFGSNPGNLSMFEYVPSSVSNLNVPLIIALHGCTQSASEYQKAGWNTLADSTGSIIVYPQTTANGSCFAWWDPANARRGAGQTLSVLQMINSVKARYSVGQVYVTGLSAGGAMTTVLLAAYPEVFTAGAVMAGIPYRCADTQNDAYTCMFGTKNFTATQWGDLVRTAAPVPNAYPRVAIWHGTTDGVVVPANADESILQWTNVNGVSATPTSTETVGAATVTRYASSDGVAKVESWRIAKMTHGTAVDAKNGCGTAGAYLLDVGICSTSYAAKFFGIAPDDGTGGGSGGGTGGGSGGGTGGGSGGGTGGGSGGGTGGGSGGGTGGGSGGGTGGGSGGGTGTTCTETFSSNYAHTQAGRAAVSSGHAITIGGNDDLGLWNLFFTSWVRETSAGYFEAGRCP